MGDFFLSILFRILVKTNIMKYVSVDIETSGLDPEKNCILSIGAIIEDTTKKLPYEELPKFNAVILQREIVGSPRAITMNSQLIKMIGDYIEGDDDVKQILDKNSGYKFYDDQKVVKDLFDFLYINRADDDYPGLNLDVQSRIVNGIRLPVFENNCKPITINVAGKNFGTFDKLFLQQLPWFKKLITVRQRVIDPAILCCEFNVDKTLPSLNQCKKRMGISGEVTHDALEDAWDVIQVLRNFY